MDPINQLFQKGIAAFATLVFISVALNVAAHLLEPVVPLLLALAAIAGLAYVWAAWIRRR